MENERYTTGLIVLLLIFILYFEYVHYKMAQTGMKEFEKMRKKIDKIKNKLEMLEMVNNTVLKGQQVQTENFSNLEKVNAILKNRVTELSS